jgi:small-conductance mechanosensitive channel
VHVEQPRIHGLSERSIGLTSPTDAVITTVTALIEELIARVGGATVLRPLMGSVTAADLYTAGIFLALAIITNALIALFLRRRRAAVARTQSIWHRNTYVALGKPLYIVIWVYGIYVAATPLLLKLRPDQGLAALRAAMDMLFDLGVVSAFFWFLFRATRLVESHWAASAAARSSKIVALLVPLFGTTLRIVVVLVGVILGLPLLGLPAQYAQVLSSLSSIMLIVGVAILLGRAVYIAQYVVLARFDMTVPDNLRARQVYTQLHVICRVLYVTIGFMAIVAVLMLFQEVRHIGTSLLASAGIIGIIAGIAAQKTLANLIAGFQIALAQPVRQDDVVVVEGEWGRVEEITLTYVIVHIWDDRRLVLPLSYFIEKPFQNWTRTSAAITGSVLIWVDYSFRVEDGRAALKAIIESSPLWDRRFWNLQVSDADQHTIQLRVLATSADSAKSWDLRCEIREKFIDFIARNHPNSLPQLRARLAPDRAAPDGP